MERKLIIDTRQQAGKHEHKNQWWASHGVSTVVSKLDFGDYAVNGSNICIDTKRNIAEIAQNINRDHARFRRELVRAKDAGYRLIILVENVEGIASVEDLPAWTNEHCVKCSIRNRGQCNPRDTSTIRCARHNTRKPIQGDRLAKAMSTMAANYGVRFEFCRPDEAAERICTLLGIDYEKG